jgi:AbrB family looped-hinge helix DNA binding protein
MAERLGIDTKVSAEGRVVIPAAVREILGVRAGDRVRFVVEDGDVRLVTAQSLMSAVWANNHGGDAGDSVRDVRQARAADQQLVEAKWARLAAQAASESRSEAEIEAAILDQLGLAP